MRWRRMVVVVEGWGTDRRTARWSDINRAAVAEWWGPWVGWCAGSGSDLSAVSTINHAVSEG